ncbi:MULTISPECIES: Imm7 family immunity protein [Chryseobacterium]|uniref:Immunity protein 7 n=1 Tax=Chryseobacterium camelliae TaxID=1265445 RepID=A0ABU0TJF4_9FLAO|nr:MULTISPECIES: Imm7 family immunity protein [Chryseobacterium]MDT3408963.1 hypothetical protein [Pseudacidovorax intermedius]MDQ1097180.1 hypothetical protein [Chryseobacterium camelliae]MDQ1101117.1 hypothetical protein [Chryseobacterium sp. SORGH_AS_1048]MDR6084560.1 hypothetical protein [Chryseobacterium sp. SORGH_AS_0909]MDR6132829.1 hypothetical protein [Chryseobacterium sp. SORGH_AS_1175]
MFEYKGWITLSFDSYEENFLKLKEQIIFLDECIDKYNNSSQFAKIVNCNENYVLSLIAVTNHENGILEDIKALLSLIAKVLPASYGVIFYRDQEGSHSNNYFVIRLSKGTVEEFTDVILSPCLPVIEN